MNKHFSDRKEVYTILFLLIVVIAVFWQVRNYEFVNYDDYKYVTENYHIRNGLSLKGLGWSFGFGYASNWHPMTWLSHMLDIELFGLNPGWHHLVNVLFHLASTFLLFLILKRMTWSLWKSAFVAGLFALHPLHVESVAWIAERKDVLSAFFWMLTMWFYLLYVEKPVSYHYLLMVLVFALGLMAKPMLVTLPFVLLLLDYWPLKRFDFNSGYKIPFHLIREKIPLFLLVSFSATATFMSQKYGGALRSVETFPIGVRIANALVCYIAYIRKMIWPVDLAVFYPHPGSSLPAWKIIMAAFLLILITAFVVATIKKLPYFFTGWFWYLGTLVPVIGLVQVGEQAMADRYTYIPLIGLFIMVTWGSPHFFKGRQFEKLFLAFSAGVVLVIVTALTWVQTGTWKNSITLFEHALKTTQNNHVAHNNLGFAFSERGRGDKAVFHFRESIKIKPGHLLAYYNLADNLDKMRKSDEAVAILKEALRKKPENAKTHNELGILLGRNGKLEEAFYHVQSALKIKPDYAEAHVNLGVILNRLGRSTEAIDHYQKALTLTPDDINAHYNLGVALAQTGRLEEAIIQFKEVLRIKPDDAEARRSLDTLFKIMRESQYQ